MRLLYFFICSSILVLQCQQFLAKTTVSTSKSIYQERFSNHQELGLYMKNDFNTVGKVAIYANLK